MRNSLILAITLVFLGAIPNLLIASPAPPIISYAVDGFEVTVSWTNVANASDYTLYYAPYPYTGPDSIESIPLGLNSNNVSYTLWDGAAYYIALTATDQTGESEYSNIESFVLSSATEEPDTPTETLSRTYPIVDTGQEKCYNSATGNEEACSGTGYDADYSGNQPEYTIVGNTVYDNVTGLTWTQSTDIDGDGQTTDADDKLSLSEARTYCSELILDGHSDWRLPDIKTLYSLILFTGEDPSGFTGTDTSELTTFLDDSFSRAFGDQDAGERLIDGQYATSTEYVSTTMNGDETMFGVNFVDGRIKGYPLTMRGSDKNYYVHCVSGNNDYGVNDYIDNGDETISDQATGLMWQKDDSQSTSFDNAVAICEETTTARYNDWRLPDAKELQSIVDYSRSPDATASAAIDPIFNATSFINEGSQTDWSYYWSSTTHATSNGSGGSGAYVSFGRALGYMNGSVLDVHGAGAQRSNGKASENGLGAPSATDSTGATFYYKGPQGDILRTDNMVRCVRDLGNDQASSMPALSEGYVLFNTMGSNTTNAIDSEGELYKQWTSNYKASGAVYLVDDGAILRGGKTDDSSTGTFSEGGGLGGIIEEISAEGEVIWSYTADTDNGTLHHDFKQIDSDTVIALSWELQDYNGSTYWNERVLMIDKATKQTTWEWSAIDDGQVYPSGRQADYYHLNSVDYQDGKILVSSRSLNTIWIIGEESKQIETTLTGDGTLLGQHDAQFLANGNILVFNNGSNLSSVLEIDPTTDRITWQYGDDFFSSRIS